jgi:FkbM family methyltransferase
MDMPDSNRRHFDSLDAAPLRARAARFGKQTLHEILWRGLGPRNYARLGRFVWMHSRLDTFNDPRRNGELDVVAAFARHIASGERVVVCDVGANVGDWSDNVHAQLCAVRTGIDPERLASETLAGVELHAFEPSPTCYAKLEARLPSWNRGARVFVSRTAIAERQGHATFTVFGETDGINTLIPMPSDVGRGIVDVQLMTLDAYALASGLARIDFLKIDTEGNDCNVLEGAATLLREHRIGLIQFEYNHRWIAYRRFMKDAFELLLPAGYNVGKVTPKGIVTYRGWQPELETFREGNYLAWPGATLGLDLPTLKWWLE